MKKAILLILVLSIKFSSKAQVVFGGIGSQGNTPVYHNSGNDVYRWSTHEPNLYDSYRTKLFGRTLSERLVVGGPYKSSYDPNGIDVYNYDTFSDQALFVSGNAYITKTLQLSNLSFLNSAGTDQGITFDGRANLNANLSQFDDFGYFQIKHARSNFINHVMQVRAGGTKEDISASTLTLERFDRVSDSRDNHGFIDVFSAPSWGYALDVKGETKQSGYLGYGFVRYTAYTGNTITLPYNKGLVLLEQSNSATSTITINPPALVGILPISGIGEFNSWKANPPAGVVLERNQYGDITKINRNALPDKFLHQYTNSEQGVAPLMFIKNSSGQAATYAGVTIPNGHGALFILYGDTWVCVMKAPNT